MVYRIQNGCKITSYVLTKHLGFYGSRKTFLQINPAGFTFVSEKNETMKLHSSVRGRIKKLLVVYNEQMQQVIGELCYKLNHHTQVVILVNQSELRKLQDFLNSRKIRWGLAPGSQDDRCVISGNNEKFEEWVRDSFLVLSESGSIHVIESSNCMMQALTPGTEKVNNSGALRPVPASTKKVHKADLSDFNLLLAEMLLKEDLIKEIIRPDKSGRVQDCDNWFVIDSGNLLIDNDFILIGGNQFKDVMNLLNLEDNCQNEKLVISLIECLLNQGRLRRKVYILGHTSQCNYNEVSIPAFPPAPDLIHIDMYITLTGKTIDGKYILLVGEPIDEKGKVVTGIEINFAALIKQIEAIVDGDGKQKFIVRRNPMPRLRNGYAFYTFSYNNCLVEIDETADIKTVWLPQFAHGSSRHQGQAFDKALREIWEDMGFRVLFIEANFHPFCQRLGALHCLTNELLRE